MLERFGTVLVRRVDVALTINRLVSDYVFMVVDRDVMERSGSHAVHAIGYERRMLTMQVRLYGLAAAFLLMGNTLAAGAAEKEVAPTFTKDVAPILFDHCVACHRNGELAPMPLITYEEVRPWARAVKQRVVSREMPPWYAESGHQSYANDASLTVEEVETIAAWVDAGAFEGDKADLPDPPKFSDNWTIGEPDAVYSMLEPFEVPVDGTVPYRYFSIPTNLSEDKWIKAVEIRPGDRRVVHHVIATLRPPEPDNSLSGESKSVGRRRGQLRGRAGVFGANSLAATVPNKFGVTYPDGVAKKIEAGTEIVLQMHYTTIGEATSDRTSVGLIFQKEAPTKKVGGSAVINAWFAIPPGAEDHEVRAERTFKSDTYLVNMTPHMHSRGKSFTYTAVFPDGTEEILLRVPHYNFDWQLTYELAEPKLLPAGTSLIGVASFDNSVNNRANPDPSALVRWGDQTWEEMMIGFYGTVDAENLDDRTTQDQQ